MQFIHHSQLDKSKWDDLVSRKEGNFYSLSWYFDACSADWMVLADDNFENGIALNFTQKLKVSFLHPPIFVQVTDFAGNDEHFRTEALLLLKERFKTGILQLNSPITGAVYRTRIRQFLSGEPVLNTLSKRMLKKAEKQGITIQKGSDWKEIFPVISQELSGKISEFTPENLKRLQQLIAAAEKKDYLLTYGILHAGELKGGMLFFETDNRIFYLKGAASEEMKKSGGMYLCMNTCITEALTKHKMLDFGGSEVPGVKQFNNNMGGTDDIYYVHEWDNTSFLYKMIKGLYHRYGGVITKSKWKL